MLMVEIGGRRRGVPKVTKNVEEVSGCFPRLDRLSAL